MKDFDVSETKRLIQSRRSIYPQLYSGEVIDNEIIEDLLESANWAPSHRCTEPWRFTVFAGEGLKKLAMFQSELYKKLAGDSFDQKKFDKLAAKPLQCSHVIAIGMKRHEVVPEIEEVEAVACAVQNMYLTARAHNLGCYWGSGGVTYKEEALDFFGLEKGDKLLGFFFVGKPKIEFPEGRRGDWREKVTWIAG
jgi:nitroreductase